MSNKELARKIATRLEKIGESLPYVNSNAEFDGKIYKINCDYRSIAFLYLEELGIDTKELP